MAENRYNFIPAAGPYTSLTGRSRLTIASLTKSQVVTVTTELVMCNNDYVHYIYRVFLSDNMSVSYLLSLVLV